jgi:hypothetical protein
VSNRFTGSVSLEACLYHRRERNLATYDDSKGTPVTEWNIVYDACRTERSQQSRHQLSVSSRLSDASTFTIDPLYSP